MCKIERTDELETSFESRQHERLVRFVPERSFNGPCPLCGGGDQGRMSNPEVIEEEQYFNRRNGRKRN